MAETIEHYARTVEQLITESRVLTAIEKGIRKPVPAARRAVRARALETLPAGGGLNKWVAKARINAKVKVTGDRVNVHFKGGRDASGHRADLNRLDLGRVRHPAWGRRGEGQWALQAVTPQFFSEPVLAPEQWLAAADAALDSALEVIR